MALDVLANYFEALTTSGGTTAVSGDNSIVVSGISGSGTVPALTSGVTQLRVMDKAQLGQSTFEVMLLTANNSGAAGTWTVTRAIEGTLTQHAAGWTMVPVDTAGGMRSAFSSSPWQTRTNNWFDQQWTDALRPIGGNSGGNNYFTALGFVPPCNITVTALGLLISTAVASSTVRCALYADNNGIPGSLLADSGDMSAATVAFVSNALGSSVALSGGLRYWTAFQASASGIALQGVNPAALAVGGGYSSPTTAQNVSQGKWRGYASMAYGAFPATAPALTYTNLDSAANGFASVFMKSA